MAGGPSSQLGIQPGDVLVSINALPAGDDIKAAATILGGPIGTSVAITIMRENQLHNFTIVRGTLPQKSDARSQASDGVRSIPTRAVSQSPTRARLSSSNSSIPGAVSAKNNRPVSMSPARSRMAGPVSPRNNAGNASLNSSRLSVSSEIGATHSPQPFHDGPSSRLDTDNSLQKNVEPAAPKESGLGLSLARRRC